jgi:hypothetical protein
MTGVLGLLPRRLSSGGKDIPDHIAPGSGPESQSGLKALSTTAVPSKTSSAGQGDHATSSDQKPVTVPRSKSAGDASNAPNAAQPAAKPKGFEAHLEKTKSFFGKAVWDIDANNMYHMDKHPIVKSRSRRLEDLPPLTSPVASTEVSRVLSRRASLASSVINEVDESAQE